MTRAIDIDDACPGMALAAAVSDGQGSTLLAAGSVLTATTLMSLRRRGVKGVVIVNEQSEAATAIVVPDARAIEARLDFLFRFQPGQGGAGLRAVLHALKLPDSS